MTAKLEMTQEELKQLEDLQALEWKYQELRGYYDSTHRVAEKMYAELLKAREEAQPVAQKQELVWKQNAS